MRFAADAVSHPSLGCGCGFVIKTGCHEVGE